MTTVDTSPSEGTDPPAPGTTGAAGVMVQVWSRDVVLRVSALSVLIAITLIGNLCLVLVISRCSALRHKRVGVFLLNLAGADLMVCCFTMTSEILFVAFGQWILGPAACKIIVYIQIVTLASTTFILTAMSIDRYQVLVQPFQSLKGSGIVRKKITAAWILALTFATPQLFIFTEKEMEVGGSMVKACVSEGYSQEWMRKVYFSFLTSYILVIPAGIMSFCYASIVRVVFARSEAGARPNAPKLYFVTSRKSAGATSAGSDPATPDMKILGRNSRNNNRDVKASKAPFPTFDPYQGSTLRRRALASKRNVVKMTLSVIICFLVCWTPYFLISLVRIFSEYEIKLTAALSASEILGLVHSALNPILYMIFSQKSLEMARLRLKCFSAFGRKSTRPPGRVEGDERRGWWQNRLVDFDGSKSPTRGKKIEMKCRCSFSALEQRPDSTPSAPFHSSELPSNRGSKSRNSRSNNLAGSNSH